MLCGLYGCSLQKLLHISNMFPRKKRLAVLLEVATALVAVAVLEEAIVLEAVTVLVVVVALVIQANKLNQEGLRVVLQEAIQEVILGAIIKTKT